MNLFATLFPHVADRVDEFYECMLQTLVMVGIVGIISFVVSLFLAVVLVTTAPHGLFANRAVYQVVDKTINFCRSVPFIILATTIIPLTRWVMGTAIGVKGAVFPLIIGITPFFTRQLESALLGVNAGLIEAATAMGLSRVEIVWRVYLRESIPRIAKVTAITIVNLLSLTAVIGVVGGGGLGDFAIRYGFQRYWFDASVAVVLVYLVFIWVVETIGKAIIQTMSRE